MNPLAPLRRPLGIALAFAAFTLGAALPQPVRAQRVQDLPAASAPAAKAAPAAIGAPAAKAAPGAARPHTAVTISPQQLQQLEQSMLQQEQVVPKSALAARAPWLTHLFAAIFLISAVGLVVLLAFQTTKQEGLSGTIGGRVEAAYRPRLGFDQQLQRITSFAAISFAVFATIVSLSGI